MGRIGPQTRGARLGEFPRAALAQADIPALTRTTGRTFNPKVLGSNPRRPIHPGDARRNVADRQQKGTPARGYPADNAATSSPRAVKLSVIWKFDATATVVSASIMCAAFAVNPSINPS